jgi:hypothetical protein
MRLLRAILVHKIQDVMTAPAKKLTPEQIDKLGTLAGPNGNVAELAGSGIMPELRRRRPDGEGLLDDSSDESDEDEPEVSEALAALSIHSHLRDVAHGETRTSSPHQQHVP